MLIAYQSALARHFGKSGLLGTILFLQGLFLHPMIYAEEENQPIDMLESVNGFTPSLKFTETLKDSLRIVTESVEGQPARKYHESERQVSQRVRITANLSGMDLSTIGPETSFEINLNDTSYSGTLGMDPTYTEANRARQYAFISFEVDEVMGNPIGSDGIKLSWSSSLLTVEVKNTGQSEPIVAGRYTYLPADGKTQAVRDTMWITLKFADRFSELGRQAYLHGTTQFRSVTYGSESSPIEQFDLENVNLGAAFDTKAPVILISAPSNPFITSSGFTVRGTASDTHEIQNIEYTTTPDDDRSWKPITQI
ncbi:MAG: hypothetical protein NTV80_01230, partial [Verrucomicrobia bacterium]|nr:hypothetical protein [Verrucomicrobiota bacterium]